MNKNEFNGYEPLYVQVSNSIKGDIQEGNYIRGAKLPNESELSEALDVSRGTIRKSLSLLNDEGYIETIHGKGSFVKDDRISSPIAQQFVSFSEDMKSQDLDFKTKVINKKIITADNSEEYTLKIESDSKLLYLERLRTVNDIPSILLYNWISLEQCPGLEKYDFENIGLFEAMEETLGEDIDHGIREFSALNANEYIQDTLKLQEDAVLRINQTSYNKDQVAIEYSDVYLRTDKYQVTSLLQR